MNAPLKLQQRKQIFLMNQMKNLLCLSILAIQIRMLKILPKKLDWGINKFKLKYKIKKQKFKKIFNSSKN